MEASARKPGNVHRFQDFPDLHYLDLASGALALVPAMDRATAQPVGRTILAAVEDTRRLVATNTNLGTVLLLAPLCAVPDHEPLLEGLASVLRRLTIEDARLAYRAIRLADPRCLGEVEDQDVWTEPNVTLTEAMSLAAERDTIARQYVNVFAEVRSIAYPALRQGIRSGMALENAIAATSIRLLAEVPDTLIERKLGHEIATDVSRRAERVLHGASLVAFDGFLRSDPNLNPGTTADLIAAALFLALSDGTIRLPRVPGPRDETGSF
jgi:triphosphoribosyl-dephospho-CoA synthase